MGTLNFDDRDDLHKTLGTTQWSVILAAGREDSDVAREALAALCATYWPAVHAFVRRKVPDIHEAQDLTQEFFARLIEQRLYVHATPQRGRFRSFLFTSVANFIVNEWHKARAEKRGGGRTSISLEFASAEQRHQFEPTSSDPPERQFDRQWAVALLNRTLELLEHECQAAGRAANFQALKPFLIGEHAATGYDQVARELGTNAVAARAATYRLRNRFRELLRAEIAQTVSHPQDVEDEMRDLFRAFE